MEDHKKDIQFVYDLFDLHSDGLSKVERSNGGIASVPNLKRILGKNALIFVRSLIAQMTSIAEKITKNISDC